MVLIRKILVPVVGLVAVRPRRRQWLVPRLAGAEVLAEGVSHRW